LFADFLDALRREKPYRKAMDIAMIIGLIKEGVRMEIAPPLVEDFSLP